MFELRRRVRRALARQTVAPLLLAGALAGWTPPVFASTLYGVTDGGVVDAAGCMTAACGASQTFADTIEGFASVSGSISIDPGLGTLGLDLTLDEPVGLMAIGGSDNGVSAIDFLPARYFALGLSLIEVLPGSKYIIDGGQTAALAGTYSQDATDSRFASPGARITGSCDVVGDTITCGLSFGATDFVLDVGATPESRYFRHTMNVTGVVPEPATGLLVSLGLVGLAIARRQQGAGEGVSAIPER